MQMLHLRLVEMPALLDHRQQLERAALRRFAYRAEVEQPVAGVRAGVDAEAAAVGGAEAHRGERVQAIFRRHIVSLNGELRAAVVVEQQLSQAGCPVERLPAHERVAFQALGRVGDVGVNANAERVEEVAAVDLAGVEGGRNPIESNVERAGGVFGQLERLESVVVARAAGNNAQANTPPRAKDAVANLSHCAIAADGHHIASGQRRLAGQPLAIARGAGQHKLPPPAQQAALDQRTQAGGATARPRRVENDQRRMRRGNGGRVGIGVGGWPLLVHVLRSLSRASAACSLAVYGRGVCYPEIAWSVQRRGRAGKRWRCGTIATATMTNAMTSNAGIQRARSLAWMKGDWCG